MVLLKGLNYVEQQQSPIKSAATEKAPQWQLHRATLNLPTATDTLDRRPIRLARTLRPRKKSRLEASVWRRDRGQIPHYLAPPKQSSDSSHSSILVIDEKGPDPPPPQQPLADDNQPLQQKQQKHQQHGIIVAPLPP